MVIHCAECKEPMTLAEDVETGIIYANCKHCDETFLNLGEKLIDVRQKYFKISQLYTDLQDHLKALLQ